MVSFTRDPIARAFELARNTSCLSISDIRRTLESEGYTSVSFHFESPTLKKQLLALVRARTAAQQPNSA